MSQGSVVEASKKVITLLADASDRSNVSEAYQLYGVRAVPHIIFVNGEGKKIAELSAQHFFEAEIVKAIDSAIKKNEQAQRKW